MVKLRTPLAALAVLLVAAVTEARTWRVERDGSGDFAALYLAVDAVAAGDTIRLGPGLFNEYKYESDYAWETYCCAHVTVPDITIIGAGADLTTVGLEHFDPHWPDFVIGISCNHNDITIRDLRVNGVFEGIHFEGPNLFVYDCLVSNNDLGIASMATSSTTVVQCTFDGMRHKGLAVWGDLNTNALVDGCEYVNGRSFALSGVGRTAWIVRDCDFHDCTGGIQFAYGAQGTVERCHLNIYGGNPPAIGVLSGSEFSLYDNVFDGDDWTAHFSGSTIVARNNIFHSGTWSTMEINECEMDFRDNHIFNGGSGPSVNVLWERGSMTQPAVINLEGNYWGTDSAAQIAEWIDDFNDYPPEDGWHYAVVDFEPFSPVGMATQATTWGAVKSLFR